MFAPQRLADEAEFVVGKITAVYGIKGWVKVHSFTAPPEGIFNYNQWHLHNPMETDTAKERGVACEVAEFRQHGKGFVAHLKGIDSREQAVLLCQKDIRVSKDQLEPLPEGEYYWQQLVGLQVITRFNDKNVLLGVITELFETGANDVIEVGPCDGSIDKRSRLIPYVPDIYVKNIDLDSRVMIVDWDPEF